MGKLIEKKINVIQHLQGIFRPHTIEAAIGIASYLHQGVFDKGGNPYIRHPMWVANQIALNGGNQNEVICGWMHDTVEDTSLTLSELSYWFNPEIIAAVKSVSFKCEGHENEERNDYIRRAAMNPIGRKVKMFDLKHNMDITRLKNRHCLTPKDLERIKIYAEEYDFLVGGSIGV